MNKTISHDELTRWAIDKMPHWGNTKQLDDGQFWTGYTQAITDLMERFNLPLELSEPEKDDDKSVSNFTWELMESMPLNTIWKCQNCQLQMLVCTNEPHFGKHPDHPCKCQETSTEGKEVMNEARMKQETSVTLYSDPTLQELKAIVQDFENFGVDAVTKVYITSSDNQRDGKTIRFRASKESA